ncbi:hypothetical protein EW146_g7020 [Bondarzewia mesenterica]|uniref:Uncharacterized protein n=1 Tax=Bondarzewia mesenterica TaxID=1095465 RepID=A0A4S4LLX2_9AGAM|nr:hypothetical protein EW146_g7020 [Bondarzewia mesenterica]
MHLLPLLFPLLTTLPALTHPAPIPKPDLLSLLSPSSPSDCDGTTHRGLTLGDTICHDNPAIVSHKNKNPHLDKRGGALPLSGAIIPHLPLGPSVEAPPPNFVSALHPVARRLQNGSKKGPRVYSE